MRRLWWIAVVGLLALLPGGVASGQAPLAPTLRFQNRFELPPAAVPAQWDLINSVVRWEPGAVFPEHTHPGIVFATTLEGEIAIREAGSEKRAAAGGAMIEQANIPHVAVNTGQGPARGLFTLVVPKGVPGTSFRVAGTTLPPAIVANRSPYPDARPPAGAVEVVQFQLDVPPGAWTARHAHSGPLYLVVDQGQLTRRTGGGAAFLKRGESFVAPVDQPQELGNEGAEPASLLGAALLPRGAGLSFSAAAPTQLPRTGEPRPVFALALVVGIALVGAAAARRRDRAT